MEVYCLVGTASGEGGVVEREQMGIGVVQLAIYSGQDGAGGAVACHLLFPAHEERPEHPRDVEVVAHLSFASGVEGVEIL